MASNFCRNCGFRLTEGKSFCGNCGTKIIRRTAAPAAPVVPAAEPVMPQPLQTVVTFHPEQPIIADLPEQAVMPVNMAAPVPEVPAEPVVTEAPAVPSVPAAPAAPVSAPQKKSHAGLIIGLVCGGVFVVALIAAGFFFIYSGDFNRVIGKGGSGTVLDRIETMEEVSSGKNYTVYDKIFEKKIEDVKWWDYDGTMKSQGVYFMNTKTLAFSIKVDDKTEDKLYYAYYYSKDDNFSQDDLKEAEISSYIAPSYYKDGNVYYNIECDKSLKPGHYCVIVSKDKNFRKPYAVAYAKILDQNSEEA